MRCPMCNEANLPMGSLGRTNHYRCRACGWIYSLTRKPRATKPARVLVHAIETRVVQGA
jgi:tRNA(Ile2) C34 agmatinyltransferase TiaS